ncbi:hypothetical protein BH11GEM2_BH11GEM2_26440 [soil metagenome]
MRHGHRLTIDAASGRIVAKPKAKPRDRCGASGKVRYANAHAAQRALNDTRRLREAGLERRREQRKYPCNLCGGWHLTSEPKAGARYDVDNSDPARTGAQ